MSEVPTIVATLPNQTPGTGDFPEGSGVEALRPNICFTSRLNRDVNDACDANGAASNLAPFISLTNTNPTAPNSKVQVIEFDVVVDLAEVANPNASANSDAWIVVRAYGTGSLFPVIPGISNASLAQVVENGSIDAQGGVFPLAVTNAILVDTNGNGQYKAAFAK